MGAKLKSIGPAVERAIRRNITKCIPVPTLRAISRLPAELFMTFSIGTRELKTARGRTMPPTVHLSDIRCKCFPYCLAMGAKHIDKGAMNVRTNEDVSIGY